MISATAPGPLIEPWIWRPLARPSAAGRMNSGIICAQAWPAAGYGYAYAWQPVMVPMMMPMMAVQMQAPPRQKECKETIVTEEWVPVKRPHRRYIPARPVPDKRVRIVPDKRVRVS